MNNFYQPAPNLQNSGRNNFPPYTNIILVDSLEHALRMPARLHSEMIYLDRYKDLMYRIYTDDYNNKQYMTLGLVKPKEPEKVDTVDDRLSRIEKAMEVLINGKHNVNADDGASSGNTAVDSSNESAE